jgi:hypothetical protein
MFKFARSSVVKNVWWYKSVTDATSIFVTDATSVYVHFISSHFYIDTVRFQLIMLLAVIYGRSIEMATIMQSPPLDYWLLTITMHIHMDCQPTTQICIWRPSFWIFYEAFFWLRARFHFEIRQLYGQTQKHAHSYSASIFRIQPRGEI